MTTPGTRKREQADAVRGAEHNDAMRAGRNGTARYVACTDETERSTDFFQGGALESS